MPEVTMNTPLDYGLVGMVLILIYKMLDFLKAVLLKKRGIQDDHVPRLICQQDPIHHERIKELHTMGADGEYSCQWKNRDEVIRFIVAQENLIEAMHELTNELRLTRNGGVK